LRDLFNTLYFFPVASSIIIIIMTFVHIHTPNFLLPKTL
jgi:ABC-type sugar transport system permease subunit